ncbi:nitroreductase [Nonomuraea phyllanthi]|uniref:Nitroreductase n=1 Tax=Nonomuraea phyllanthi TaxID=2219224 RepID=A0A5C4WP19_9ACTN|nr:nitroreductase [Nonomuraea phyllanthi]KAB8195364.1 nitroreductase [Nonomuraea phyllanthi]
MRDRLRALEPDFWRAPSAHNTQPWTLTYAGDEAVIGWDPSRALPISDPTGRDLRLSLGAFVECCLIVCADAGLSVGFRPDPGPGRAGVLHAAARPYATPFRTADVRDRGTNRGAYHPGRLPDGLVAELAGVRRLACRDLADLLYAADLHQFADRDVTRELRAWLRLTRRHRRYLLDGLTDRALALGRAEAAGLRASLALYPALRPLGLPRALAAASRGLLDHDGDVLVLVGPVEDELGMGRVLMRHWLTLSRHGYAAHPLSQIIDCDPTRRELAGRLGIADPRTLLHVARVGRPVAPAARSARTRA